MGPVTAPLSQEQKTFQGSFLFRMKTDSFECRAPCLGLRPCSLSRCPHMWVLLPHSLWPRPCA